MRAIDTLNLQGKQGAFTLANLAKRVPRYFLPMPPPAEGQRVSLSWAPPCR